MKTVGDNQFELDGLRLCRVRLSSPETDQRLAVRKELSNYRSHFIDDSESTGIKFFSTVCEALRIKEHFVLEMFDAEKGKWSFL
jgi:hypothetical protein